MLPTLPDVVDKTAHTYVSPISYTASTNTKTYQYDADGKLTNQPDANGYYRKILGTTNDGRTVAQDFYGNNAPQTAIFIIKQGADESSFESDVNDSDTIWFDKDGNITEITLHDSGWFINFQEGKPSLYGYDKDNQGITIALNYPNTQKLMAYIRQDSSGETLIYFYENGNAMLKVTKINNEEEGFAWDEEGKSISPKKRQKEIEHIGQLGQTITQQHGVD